MARRDILLYAYETQEEHSPQMKEYFKAFGEKQAETGIRPIGSINAKNHQNMQKALQAMMEYTLAETTDGSLASRWAEVD